MKRITGKKMQKEPVMRMLVLFLLGMLLGMLFAWLIQMVEKTTRMVNEEYLKCLLEAEIDLPDLFFYTLWEHLKELLLFFLLILTWLNQPYTYFSLLRQGFFMGFLVSAFFKAYHMQGLILTLAYYFPQCVIQIPLWMFCYQTAWELLEERKNRQNILGQEREIVHNEHISLHKLNMLHLNGKSAILILGLCAAASAAEVWAGTWFLKRIVGWILGA